MLFFCAVCVLHSLGWEIGVWRWGAVPCLGPGGLAFRCKPDWTAGRRSGWTGWQRDDVFRSQQVIWAVNTESSLQNFQKLQKYSNYHHEEFHMFMSRSRSERGHRHSGMCGNKSHFDAGCAEKRRQKQAWNSRQRVSGICQSEADSESKWLFGKSNCSRGITSSQKVVERFTKIHFETMYAVVFAGTYSIFMFSISE